jgi:hypothetical protein
MSRYKKLFAEIRECHRMLGDRFPDLDSQITPATEEQVAKVQARLRRPLPPSYREFVLTVNGCPKLEMAHGGLWPVTKIDWFRKLNPDWIAAYTIDRDELDDVTKEEHLANPDDSPRFRNAYLPKLLQIGELFDGSVYLLNPMVTTASGEWEAWSFANWYPGARRKPSFRALVVSAHKELKYEMHLCSIQFDEADLMDKVLPVLRRYIAEGVHPTEAVGSFLSDPSNYNDAFAAWMRTTQPYYALLKALGYDL